MSRPSVRRIGVAIGDPNGIGPEIAVKSALCENSPVLIGDLHVIEHYARAVARDAQLRIVEAPTAPVAGTIDVVPVDALARADFAPGCVSAQAGRATVAYIKAAIELTRSGTIGAIIGCPHNETAVNAAGIAFTGYPELLADLLGLPAGKVFLMLVGGGLRIVHATLHERLGDALKRLTPELVISAALAAVEALKQLGVDKPRLGLFGINPHAGEGGLFGPDDNLVTAPASAHLRALGVDIKGPVGADLLLGRKDIDAFVAMYHDQGHIPVKLLAGRTASALSIGAGLLFSTVGHGSAHDIAGRNIADPEAVIRTLRLLEGAAGGI